MPRPKSNLPVKEKLNLSIKKESKEQLQKIAYFHQTSISEIVETYAAKEFKRLEKLKK